MAIYGLYSYPNSVWFLSSKPLSSVRHLSSLPAFLPYPLSSSSCPASYPASCPASCPAFYSASCQLQRLSAASFAASFSSSSRVLPICVSCMNRSIASVALPSAIIVANVLLFVAVQLLSSIAFQSFFRSWSHVVQSIITCTVVIRAFLPQCQHHSLSTFRNRNRKWAVLRLLSRAA